MVHCLKWVRSPLHLKLKEVIDTNEVSRKLHGEVSTTEQDSEQEEDSLTQTKKSTLKKKSTPVKRKSSLETTKLPLSPATLRSKNKNDKADSVHGYQCIH